MYGSSDSCSSSTCSSGTCSGTDPGTTGIGTGIGRRGNEAGAKASSFLITTSLGGNNSTF